MVAVLDPLASAEEFDALISQPKDGILTFRRIDSRQKSPESITGHTSKTETLALASDVSVTRVKAGKPGSGPDREDYLPDGLANAALRTEMERPGGIRARLTTDDKNGKVRTVRILPPNLEHPANADEGASEAPPGVAASVSYLLLGLKENRERLRSGIFRAYGLNTINAPGEPPFRENVDMYGAFDDGNERFRLDLSVPYRLLLPPAEAAKEKDARPWRAEFRKTQVVLTPSQLISTTESAHSVNIYSSSQKKEVEQVRGKPFDVRCFGLYYFLGFERRPISFDSMYQVLLKAVPREAERDANGMWKIVREYTGKRPQQCTLWMDETRGFTIVRSEARFQMPASQAPAKSIVWREPTETSDVTWTFENNVWVPKTFKLQCLHSNVQQSYDLSFEWESVNQPVPENLFTVEGLSIKDRRVVFDQTTGQPVITGVLNDDVKHMRSYGERTNAYQERRAHSRVVRIVLVNAIIVVFAGGISTYLWRRRHGKALPDSAHPGSSQ